MRTLFYAGTYTHSRSDGIYHFTMDNGKLSEAKLFSKIKNPKYITTKDGKVLTVCDMENRAGVALLNSQGEILDQIAYEPCTSCFITEKDNRIYTANYHEGTFTVLEIKDDKLKLIETVQIQQGAGCHQVLLWKDYILVPCLFLDRVVIYNKELERVGSIKFNQGVGPRHGVFTKDEEYLYLAAELSNELYVIHAGDWEVLDSISILPNNQKQIRDTAAIRLSEDEKYVYVSTRTKDIISVVEMKNHTPRLIQTIDCGGEHPRDFILHENYALVANRNTNEVVVFEINKDGTIGSETSRTKVPEVVCLRAEEEE